MYNIPIGYISPKKLARQRRKIRAREARKAKELLLQFVRGKLAEGRITNG